MSAVSAVDSYSLVLNKNWLAIGVTTVRHAVSLLFTGSARAVHPETLESHDFQSWADLHIRADEPCIRSVALTLKAPEIIVLRAFAGVPKRRVIFSRRNIFRRDHYTCQYCGKKEPPSALTIEHVVPRSRGGKTTWQNCVLACFRCNTRKGNHLPKEVNMRLIRRPSEPPWVPYFSIPLAHRKVSWERFVSDAYWDAQLEE